MIPILRGYYKMNRYAIVLAAGKGTRMKSKLDNKSKVSYEILGVPLVKYVLKALKPLDINEVVTIVGFGGETTTKIVESESSVVWQHEQKGTGHAIMQTTPVLADKKGATIILCGDTPLLRSDTLQQLFEQHDKDNESLTVLGAKVMNPRGYGRLIQDDAGDLLKIVEQKDCTKEQELVDIVNAGVYVFDNELLYRYLKELKPNNKAGEYYLTDLVEIFKNHGHKVGVSVIEGEDEMQGINDRLQLSNATRCMRERINAKHMLSGVTIEDPNTTYIGPDVVIAPDTIIKPNTSLLGISQIGERNEIGPNSYLENVVIGDDNKIIMSHIVDSSISSNNNVGPFARLRGHTKIENNVRVGNFVEIKNAHLRDGAKSAHLTYLGDADVGEKTNIGCGTIIANYDGYNKTHTSIGNSVFVGSGSIIISPITIEDDAFVAAGTVVTRDVKKDELAIARARQDNKAGYSHIIKNKAKAKKEASKK